MKIHIESTELQKIRQHIKNDALLRGMLNCTLPELQDWLDTNLTNTGSAIELLERLTVVVWFLARSLKAAAT